MEFYRELLLSKEQLPDAMSLRVLRWLVDQSCVQDLQTFLHKNGQHLSAATAIEGYRYLYANGYDSQRAGYVGYVTSKDFRRWLIRFTLDQGEPSFDVLRKVITSDEFTEGDMDEVLSSADTHVAAWILYNCQPTHAQVDQAADIILADAAATLRLSCGSADGWNIDSLRSRHRTARKLALGLNYMPTTLRGAEALWAFESPCQSLDMDVLRAVVTQCTALDVQAHNSGRDINRVTRLISEVAASQPGLSWEHFEVMAAFEDVHPTAFCRAGSSKFFTEKNFETYVLASSGSPEACSAAMDDIAGETSVAVQQWLIAVLLRQGTPDRQTLSRIAPLVETYERVIELDEFARFAPLETETVLALMRAARAGATVFSTEVLMFSFAENLEEVYVENERRDYRNRSNVLLSAVATSGHGDITAVSDLAFRMPMCDLDGFPQEHIVKRLHEVLGDDADAWQAFEVVVGASPGQSTHDCAAVAMKIITKQR